MGRHWRRKIQKMELAGPRLPFYEAHFADCLGCEPLSYELGIEAEALAVRYGVAVPDALQLSAAIRQGVEEFYTSEKPGKPMFRVKELNVLSLYSLAF
jgi:hypothetical protein